MRAASLCATVLSCAWMAVVPAIAGAQSVLVDVKTSAGAEVATIRTDSMRLAVPLHLLVGGLVFPDGTLQTTAGGAGATSVTTAEIVDGTIVNADISDTAAIADTKLAIITAAGKVANSATTATSSNTPDAIVARDAAGGFAARYVAVGDSLRIRGEGSFLASGIYNPGSSVPAPGFGTGARMMWYPERAAFRVGFVGGGNWDTGNLGTYSVAGGYNTLANASFATAFGSNAQAIGPASTALGQNTHATNTAATAFGNSTTASGVISTAFGSGTVASGYYSTATGNQTTAVGYMSTSMGFHTTAQAYTSLVIGQYNVVQGNPTLWVVSDVLFAAGNGTSATTPSNALTLYKNGNLVIAGGYGQSSDARLKEDMEPLEGTLDKVMQLTPIRYRFRTGTGRPEGAQLGLTAQQVQPLFPELVTAGADGYLSLSYGNLSAVLVRAVQEQQAEIETLKTHNQELESELAALRASQAEILRRLQKLEAGKGR